MKTKNKNWVSQAEKFEKNNFWIKKSQKLALKILMHLRKEKITQAELASKLEVSPQQINKIVKGGVNLTLETICKIERELKTEFLVIPEPIKWRNIRLVDYNSFRLLNSELVDYASYNRKSEILNESIYFPISTQQGKIIPMRSATAREYATTVAPADIRPDQFLPLLAK